MNSRRGFLVQSLAIGMAGRLLAQKQLAWPFDTIPQSAWKRARQNGLCMIHQDTPSNLTSHVKLAGDREPGEPLTISGQVFAPDGRTPAAGVTVYAYHIDAAGYYGV